MILAVDIGNSRSKFALMAEGEITGRFDMPTESFLTGETEGAALFVETLRTVSTAWAASVVPHALHTLTRVIANANPALKLKAIAHGDVPLVTAYDKPTDLGIDRLLTSYAAWNLYAAGQDQPMFVVDFGTATTYNCIGRDGVFLGGAIGLGIGATVAAISRGTAQLPEIEIQFPESVVGRTTVANIQSGVLFGALEALNGMIARIEREAFVGERPIVIATGGFGALMKSECDRIDILDEDLLLKGVWHVAETRLHS